MGSGTLWDLGGWARATAHGHTLRAWQAHPAFTSHDILQSEGPAFGPKKVTGMLRASLLQAVCETALCRGCS